MTIEKKIDFLCRAIESVKRDRPPDAFAGLSERHKEMIKNYRKTISPLDQYIDYIENRPSPESLIPDSIGLPCDLSASAAQAFFQDFNCKLSAHYARRTKQKDVTR